MKYFYQNISLKFDLYTEKNDNFQILSQMRWKSEHTLTRCL